MVLAFYNLREQPFGVTPDPKYLYFSPTHREALASLEYGITSSRGFLGLIAPPGMGKTTILFRLLEKLSQSARTVFIFQTHATPRDFLRNLMSDLGMCGMENDLMSMQAALNKMLLEEAKAGKRVVVVVDEAQSLEDPVLEHLRMLSNFETTSEKLIQIVLAGQTQLAEKLASPGLVQLRQRISIMGRLAPFDQEETKRYICHRLAVAGFDRELPLFTSPALRLIAEASGGIPRNINNICFNALALGCANRQRMIPTETIQEVCQDLDLRTISRLAPSNTTVQTRPAARSGVTTRVAPSTKRVFPRWLPRFGVAASIVAMSVAGFSALKHGKSANPLEAAPVSSTANTTGLPISMATPKSTAKQQDPASTATEARSISSSSTESGPSLQAVSEVRQPEALDFVRTVRVAQDQTLYSIAIHELGQYNLRNVKAIQELNPWLTNPDHILAGEEIRIPETTARQENSLKVTKSSAEAEKP